MKKFILFSVLMFAMVGFTMAQGKPHKHYRGHHKMHHHRLVHHHRGHHK